MPSTCSEPRRRAGDVAQDPIGARCGERRVSRHPFALASPLAAFLTAAACSFAPPPIHPRPPLPPPVAAAPVPPPELRELKDLGDGRSTGVLAAAGEEVRFHLRRADGNGRKPLVLCVPILAGGDELMESVASRMRSHGFDVAFCARAGSALKPPQRGRDLDLLFQRTVLHQRILLAWLGSGPDAPTATFVLGMSMGGMVATVVAAEEPAVAGLAVCLSGADLGGLVLSSSERRVRSWREWRHTTDGVGDDHLRWEMQEFLVYEPLGFAAAIPTQKVLFVGADLDSVVPRRNQDLLWEALGRPPRLQVPLGHYTAALAIDTILGAAASHFAGLAADRPRAARPPHPVQ